MLSAGRILVLIAIVECVMQILGLFVQVIGPKEKTAISPGREMREMLNLEESDVARRTLVWYISGLVSLGVAAALAQPWLQLSFGIAGVCAMLIGCNGGAPFGIGGHSALLIGGTGGAFAGRQFLWLRFPLNLLILVVLVLISLRRTQKTPQTG